MASLCCCPPVAQVCGLPPLESGSGRLSVGMCPQTAVRPKTLSHPMGRLGNIKRNAMSHQGFSTSPHAPARDREFSCACMIVHTWKLSTTRQKLSGPHLAFATSSHKLASVERATKSRVVVCNERKRISWLTDSSTQMPGGDASCGT